MGLYLDNGYIDMDWIMARKATGYCIIGGRGTGKTYGAMKYLIESNKSWLYLRRTAEIIETIKGESFNPICAMLRRMGIDYTLEPEGKITVIKYNDVKCVMLGLSKVAGLRGFDSSYIDYILYDEFIPEEHEREIKSASTALMNCYETINRNRELDGHPPVKLILLANSNNIFSEILQGFYLTEHYMSMIKRGVEYEVNNPDGWCIVYLANSPISRAKSNTFIYSQGNTVYNNMAIANSFGSANIGDVKSLNLRGCTPLSTLSDEFTIYARPKNDGLYIASPVYGQCLEYTNPDMFARDHLTFARCATMRLCVYQTVTIKEKFLSLFGIRH